MKDEKPQQFKIIISLSQTKLNTKILECQLAFLIARKKKGEKKLKVQTDELTQMGLQ